MGWYIGFIVHQIVKFAWAVSRMFHVVVDHVEDLEASVDGATDARAAGQCACPRSIPGSSWWSAKAVAALTGVTGRVLHAECGNGSLVGALIAAGVDAYGVDPTESVIEAAVERGLDVRAESVLGHLEVVADEALSGLVLSGSIQWLHPNQRDRLVNLAASRLAVDGVLVIHSATPESWMAGTSHLISDLAPGRPLHAETWGHLLAQLGLRTRRRSPGAATSAGSSRVGSSNPDAGRHQRRHRRGQRTAPRVGRVPPGRRPGAVTAVHQFVPALLPRDATGDHTLELRDTLRREGWESDIYVEAAHDELKDQATYFERYPERAKPGDILLYQLSTASPVADFLLTRPETLVLDYHNITPPSFYEGWEDHTAEKVALALTQAAELAPRGHPRHRRLVRSTPTGSGRSAAAATEVVPILVEMDGTRSPVDEAEAARLAADHGPGTVLLFVGRISPNKTQHHLVEALWLYRRWYDPDARLHLVGPAVTESYAEAVFSLAEELGLAHAVRHGEHLSDAQLAAWYADADVFVCLSEHEGFCIPLLEAMRSGLPIVAFGAGAVPETLGAAGILLDSKRPSVVAAAVDRVRGDADLWPGAWWRPGTGAWRRSRWPPPGAGSSRCSDRVPMAGVPEAGRSGAAGTGARR